MTRTNSDEAPFVYGFYSPEKVQTIGGPQKLLEIARTTFRNFKDVDKEGLKVYFFPAASNGRVNKPDNYAIGPFPIPLAVTEYLSLHAGRADYAANVDKGTVENNFQLVAE